MTRMHMFWVGAIIALLMPWMAVAQSNESSPQAAAPPFDGVLTGRRISIRSGPGTRYYRVMRLDEGAPVRVLKKISGDGHQWYVIEPPAGAYSYIYARFVKVDADGKTGVVTGSRVNVRAPSPAGPATSKSYKVQLQAKRGDQLVVMGREGDWLKIQPPAGAELYVAAEFVKPGQAGPQAAGTQANTGGSAVTPANAAVSAAAIWRNLQTGDSASRPEAAPSRPARPVAYRPTEASAPTRSTVQFDPPKEDIIAVLTPTLPGSARPGSHVRTRCPEITPEMTHIGGSEAALPVTVPRRVVHLSAEDRFKQLESQYERESRQSPEQQQIDGMIQGYLLLLEDPALPTTQRRMAQMRVEVLKTRRDLAQSLQKLARTEQELTAVASTAQQQQEAMAKAQQEVEQFTAMGRLMTSSVYNGRNLPLLYRLTDPNNPTENLTKVYIQAPADAKVGPLIGRVVGVQGEMQFDRRRGINIIQATAIRPLRVAP